MNWNGYEIQWIRSARCKRIILTYIAGENRLRLSTPKRISTQAVESFLQSRLTWIEARVKKDAPWQPAYLPGEQHLVLGQYVCLGQDGVPAGEKAFRRWQEEKLLQVAQPMLDHWAKRLQVSYAGLRLRDMTSRWGSCQVVKRVITLNLRLIRVEKALIDYVAAHEVCHLVDASHGEGFHRLMDDLMPDWPQRRKILNSIDLRPRPPRQT